ncbi:hypothetical protein EW146_g305 [Bondarzewia mesenterica]|uniref:cystathionine gamma-lyase n=1 Tax=Bondarzewia mesenterica TaxID=1095465 RepID=A0A4S4M7X7_9AGAM|nr:hypothetical protein EW146_g305 [Bondarzewia mesenterica]
MTSPSESVSEVVRTKFGPLLLGVIVTAILYGVTFLQTIYYFDHYPKDTIVLKATARRHVPVAALWIIDTLIMALDCHVVYYYSILRFGDASALGEQTWTMDLESSLTVELFSTIFHISYLDQISNAGLRDVSMSNVFRLSNTKIEQGILSELQAREVDILLSAPDIQSLLTIATFATSLAITVIVFSKAVWSTVTTGMSLFIGNVSLAAAVDFFITIVLCIPLYSNRSGLQSSNIINRLITFMITRGIITNSIRKGSADHLPVPVYTNAVLASLNNRSPRVEDPTFTSHVGYSSAGELYQDDINVEFRPESNTCFVREKSFEDVEALFRSELSPQLDIEGIEKIRRIGRGPVPVIVVFTNYDELVGLKILRTNDGSSTADKLMLLGRELADEDFEERCVCPMREVAKFRAYHCRVQSLLALSGQPETRNLNSLFLIRNTVPPSPHWHPPYFIPFTPDDGPSRSQRIQRAHPYIPMAATSQNLTTISWTGSGHAQFTTYEQDGLRVMHTYCLCVGLCSNGHCDSAFGPQCAHENQGVKTTFVDLENSDEVEIKGAIQENAKAIWIEFPTISTLRLIDIHRIVSIAHAHPSNPLALVDNASLSPFYSSPLQQGTRSGKCQALMTADSRSRVPRRASAHEGPRVQRTSHGACAGRHRHVTNVICPGLAMHPRNALARRSLSPHPEHFVDTFFAASQDVSHDGSSLTEATRLYTLAENLGGVESLAELPALMTHGSIPPKEREQLGIGKNSIRLSVGIEEEEDLVRDVLQALEGFEYSQPLERTLASPQSGDFRRLAFARGSATTATAISSLGTNAHVVSMSGIYGGTSHYMARVANYNQDLETTLVEFEDGNEGEIKGALWENTKVRTSYQHGCTVCSDMTITIALVHLDRIPNRSYAAPD